MTSDERLKRLERWLAELYSTAEKDMRGKWDEYLARQEKRAETLLSHVGDAKTPEEKKAAEEKYQAFLKSKTAGDKHYRDMVNELARQYHDVNVRAAGMVNGQRTAFFADGYNLSADKINDVALSQDIGIRFDMCSAEAVEWLAERQNDLILPGPANPMAREDMTWNVRQINAQMAQGIVQGESIPKIAARLQNVTDMNHRSAIRNARTMATGCQNAGRVQSMKTAEEWGVHTRKQWLSQHDGRTRHTHDDPPPNGVSGETVGPDAWFSNGCRYPGDPVGPASEVYNCRCTLVTVIDGFSSNLPKGKEDAVHVWIDGEEVTGEHITKTAKERKPRKRKTADGTHVYNQQYSVYALDNDLNITEEHTYTVTREKKYGFPDGTANGVYKKRDADVYTTDDGVRFIVPSSVNREKQPGSPIDFMQAYYRLPPEYRSQIQRTIHILDYRNPQDANWEKRYGIAGFRSYATGGKEISFYEYPEGHDSDYLVKTFAHEGAHYIDKWKDGAKFISDSTEWKNAMDRDFYLNGLKGPTDYAQAANAEDFAESVAYYVTERSYMENNFPNRTEIIRRTIENEEP